MARIQAGAMSSSTRPANCRLNLRLLGTKAANYTSIGRRKWVAAIPRHNVPRKVIRSRRSAAVSARAPDLGDTAVKWRASRRIGVAADG
jgi:hypothetical protein